LKVKRAAAVLFVEAVEATRDFFVRAGFTAEVTVPDGDAVGFAILERDAVQVMVQTRDNGNEPQVYRDMTKASRHAAVFIEVDDLAAVIAALDGEKVLLERHKTFYGSEELTYVEPGGHLVTFAQFP
jgi:hypothetical protein